MFEGKEIDELLGRLGIELEELDTPVFEIVVIGGAALNILGLVSRVTRDIDCLAFVERDESGRIKLKLIEEFPEIFRQAANIVAENSGLDEKWINAEPTELVSQRLPEGIEERLVVREYGKNLKVHLISRYDLIHLKVYAAEQGPGKHVNDLLALNPTVDEIEQAVQWCFTQDPSEGFRLVMKDMLEKIGFGDVAAKI